MNESTSFRPEETIEYDVDRLTPEQRREHDKLLLVDTVACCASVPVSCAAVAGTIYLSLPLSITFSSIMIMLCSGLATTISISSIAVLCNQGLFKTAKRQELNEAMRVPTTEFTPPASIGIRRNNN